jgi:hypothetical protein
VDFKTLRQAFRADYPDLEGSSQTDLLLFQLLKAFKNETITVPVETPASSTIRLVSPTSGSEVVAGIPFELFAVSTLPRTVGKVEFYVGSTKIGEDRNVPYNILYTPPSVGAITLKAVAISPDGATSVNSENVTINVVASPTPITPNTPPTVSLANPGSVTAGNTVTLSATASDSDGISKVEFYQGAVKLGEDTSSPYNQAWTPSTAGTYVLTAVAYDTKSAQTASNAVNVTVTAATIPTNPTPTVSVSVPKAGKTSEAVTLSATASVSGDTIASVQFQVNGSNQGTADTSSPFSTSWTPSAKGTFAIRAIATGVLGGTATSNPVNIPIFDTKVVGQGTGAGTSLGAVPEDFILFDNNQGAGGNAAIMNVFVNGEQVAAFNYGDTAYNGKPFAYFNSGNSTLYTGTIGATVNF